MWPASRPRKPDPVAVVNVVDARLLRRDLKRAGADMNELKAIHARTGRMVADAAIVPRVSGALAGTVRPATQVSRAIVRAGKGKVRYANPIHWGWPARNIAPNTFLIDAAHRTQPAWLNEYRAEVQRIIDSVSGGGEGIS